MISGCNRSMPDSERNQLATAYVEVMIARNMFRSDSSAMHRAMDSVSRAYGFDNESDLRSAISKLSEEPENLRKMFDTAQRRLESIQSNAGTAVTPDSSNADSIKK